MLSPGPGINGPFQRAYGFAFAPCVASDAALMGLNNVCAMPQNRGFKARSLAAGVTPPMNEIHAHSVNLQRITAVIGGLDVALQIARLQYAHAMLIDQGAQTQKGSIVHSGISSSVTGVPSTQMQSSVHE